jgi:hypothetical protein
LRLAFWPKIWSILEKFPWAADKNVYCAVDGWNVCEVHLIYGVIQFWSFFVDIFIWMTYLLLREEYWQIEVYLFFLSPVVLA